MVRYILLPLFHFICLKFGLLKVYKSVIFRQGIWFLSLSTLTRHRLYNNKWPRVHYIKEQKQRDTRFTITGAETVIHSFTKLDRGTILVYFVFSSFTKPDILDGERLRQATRHG